MKKFAKMFFMMVLVLACALVVACGKKNPDDGGQGSGSELNGTYKITVWVSETEGVTALTETQIKEFEKANPGIKIEATVEGVSESDSATQMIADVEAGADIFCFAQDQLVRLVNAGALAKLGQGASATVKELNDSGAIKAATVGEDLWCYPLTSDNGYYMYYDKSVIDESHLDSLEDLIADCEKANRLFCMELETSAWYNAAFFFATGCNSEWTNDGKAFTSVTDDFNSDKGLIALKGMQKLLKSPAYKSSSDGAEFSAAVPAAILISGTWVSGAVKGALGANYAATDLPSFTVDGKSYHLGSYSGNKLMGVKPQTDAKRAAVLQKLALFLTNETCQLERFEAVGWGPSNLNAQKSSDVQGDPALAALALQSAYAIPQGQIHGSWWDIAKTYAAAAKTATTDDELRAALADYEKAIKGLFSMSTDEKEAFTVIGKFDGHNWDFDAEMEQKPEGTFMTPEPIHFLAGDEFKVRQGKSWDVNFGKDGVAGGDNIVVEAEGYYFVKLVYDKATNTASSLTLEKYSPAHGWTVIGKFAGHNWDFDAEMEIQADGSWLSGEIEFAVDDEFKVRQGLGWDMNYGANGVAGGDNVKITEAGTYRVKLVVNADGSAELTLVK